MKHGKTYRQAVEAVDRTQSHDLDEAVDVLKAMPPAKFDESVDLSVKLGACFYRLQMMIRKRRRS